jgi:PKD repeat protein
MNWLKKFLSITLAAFASIASAQMEYYEASFHGGITVGGWSPNISSVTDNGSFSIYIEPGSTIHAAFLIASRLGPSMDAQYTLNGTPYIFDASTEVTGGFSTLYGSPSGVHVIDVTADINPATLNYNVNYDSGPSFANFQDMQLVVFYDNPALATVSGAIYLNTENLDVSNHTWTTSLSNPIDNTADVGVSFFTSYQCDNLNDSEQIWLNGVQLGNVGGNDVNSGGCTGTLGNCYYQNASLNALGDDNTDLSVNGSDALTNAASLITNGSTTFDVDFIHQSGSSDNHQWSMIVMYGANCTAPAVNFSANSPCIGEDVVFTNLSDNTTVSWSWTFGDVATSTLQNPTHLYAAAGSYAVTLTGTNAANCSASATVNVVVNPTPVITIANDFNCPDNEVVLTASGAASYLWSNSAPTASTTVVANDGDSYSVAGTTASGCTGTASYTLDIPAALEVVATAIDATCGNADGHITADASNGMTPYTYAWTGVASALPSLNVGAGTYSVQVTDANGCVVISDPVVVNQIGMPNVNIIQQEIACPGDMVMLLAEGADSYVWNTGAITDSIVVESILSSLYWVEGTAGACEDVDSMYVDVLPLPTLDVTPILLMDYGTTQQLVAVTEANVVWEPSTFLSCDNCLVTDVTPTDDIIYQVTATDPITGCYVMDTAAVYINLDYSIYAPNAMTCDNDGLNELFKVYGPNITNPRLVIFNRWGVSVFETTNLETYWTGDSGTGYYAPNGVYLWQLEYDTDKGRQISQGVVTVLR